MAKTSILTLIALTGLAATAGPLGAQTSEEREQLQEARSELAEARQALEEAAREVARLSAQAAGPAIRGLNIFSERAVLGINISDSDSDSDSDSENGVRVDGVTPGGPAAGSGVETGDVIVAMDGAELTGDSPAELLVAQMENVSPGDTVTLTVVRDGDEQDIEVVTGASTIVFSRQGSRQDDGDRRFSFTDLFRNGGDAAQRLVNFRRQWGDMEMVELTPELGAYFGTETGILVVRAPSDEALEALQDGDVILDIGGRVPNSTQHAVRILSSFESGEALELEIMRDQRRQTLEVQFP